MALTTTNITTNSTTLVGTLKQGAHGSNNDVGIHAHGTFGSGTMTFQYSLDGGTTKVTIKSGEGTSAADIEYTASGGFTWISPLSTGGAAILLYAVLTGATSPDINVYVISENAG